MNYYRYERKDLIEFIPPSNYTSLLDIGCGEGNMSLHAKGN